MALSLPPIVKTAERLLLEVEQAVRGFARFHKYALGSDLRKLAMKIAMLAHRAWRDVAARVTLLSNLDRNLQEMKIALVLGSRLKAFSSDMGDVFNAVRDDRKRLRAMFGVKCPKCATVRPKAQASILLPQQRCKVDGYRDQRQRLTNEQREAAGCAFYVPEDSR